MKNTSQRSKKSSSKKRKTTKQEVRPPVKGLTIADRFDLDDGYFDRPVEWDGGWHDDLDVW